MTHSLQHDPAGHDPGGSRRAEHALQESEERMRAIFETAIDGIITIDEAGRMERMNPAAEHMFGWREHEVRGRDVAVLMPEPHRSLHDGYLRTYLGTGRSRIIGKGREVQGLRRDGTVFPMELAVTEMRIGGKRMFTGLVRDISARNAVEEEVRRLLREVRRLAAHQESIKEEERRRIAREIHDELGGLLTGIKAYISVAASRAAAAGAPSEPLLEDAAGLAQTAIETVRRVITDLRPSVLDQLGIWAALEWYAPQVAQRSGLACRCAIDDDVAALTLDDERSIMLFRVAQEALTNVVRHAGATQVSLHVRRIDGELEMRIEDDGKGIGPAAARDSWGILGMQERSRRFGGAVMLTARPGGGTRLLLRVPLADRDDINIGRRPG